IKLSSECANFNLLNLESQIPQSTEDVEGRSITLSCSYTGSPRDLHWYQQKPGSRPEFLVLINEASGTNVTAQQLDPRLSIILQKNNKKVDLEISSTAVSDSALYYCALQPTVTETHQTLY
uniref:Ig-like domain-containing protein n=1 Tax=Astyanax mexicanus TaxID=7994 RepID=A0A8B9LPI7_ASTMX